MSRRLIATIDSDRLTDAIHGVVNQPACSGSDDSCRNCQIIRLFNRSEGGDRLVSAIVETLLAAIRKSPRNAQLVEKIVRASTLNAVALGFEVAAAIADAASLEHSLNPDQDWVRTEDDEEPKP